MRGLWLVAALAAVGCGNKGKGEADASASASAPASASASAPASASASASAPAFAPASAWGSRSVGAFSYLVDGPCLEIAPLPIDNGVLLSVRGTLAWLEGEKLDVSAAVMEGFAPGSMVPRVAGGKYPDAVWLAGDTTYPTGEPSDVWVRRGATWKQAPRIDEHGQHMWGPVKDGDGLLFVAGDNYRLSQYGPRLFALSPDGEPRKPVSPVVVPKVAIADFVRVDAERAVILSVPAESEGESAPGVHVVDKAKVTSTSLAPTSHVGLTEGRVAPLRAHSDSVVFVLDPKTGRFKKDEPVTNAVATLKGRVARLHDGEGGKSVWAVMFDGRLVEISVTGEVRDRTPSERLLHVDGIDRGDVWVVGKKGTLFHLVKDAWAEVPLPRSPFATKPHGAKTVRVLDGGRVLVRASALERREGWVEPLKFEALLTNTPTQETFRCVDAYPNDTTSPKSRYRSWPPLADASCKTPVAVLGLRAYSRPFAKDAADAREALKGLPGAGATLDLLEIDSEGGVYLAIAAPSFAVATEIATRVAKKVKTATEVVCGTPTPKKTIRFDVATGELAK